MALETANPTFLDLHNIMGMDGSILDVAEVLNATNEGIMEWMSWQEGNLPTGHMHAFATTLPSVAYGQLYKGVTASKGTNRQVTDTTMLLESLAEVDYRVIEMSSDPDKARWIHDRKHLEAMRQEFFNVLFYGNPDTNHLQFRGFTPRYADTSEDNGDNILLSGLTPSGGTPGVDGDVESIWLVGWHPATCFGIVPKNAPGGPGLQMMDEGMVTLEDGDGNGGRLRIYRTWFQMWSGLAITDWRYVVRIANLDYSQVNNDPADGGPNLIEFMKDAIERIPSEVSDVRLAFYASRDMRSKIRKQYSNSVKNSTLEMMDVGGLSPRASVQVDGVPVYQVDALARSKTGGEATVS